MKKQKRQPEEAPEKVESTEKLDNVSDEHEPAEDDRQAQKLSEIESVEVTPTDEHEASVDPDKVLVVKKPEKHLPWWKQRKFFMPLGGLLVVIILLAIPPVRFLALGWAWHETVLVTVVDSSNNRPVSDAKVTIGDKHATTDNAGRAVIGAVSIGYHTAKIEKANYKTLDNPVTVDVFSATTNRQVTFTATGRPVVLKVVDRITGRSVADANLTDSKQARIGRTDGDGRVTVVLPVNAKEFVVSVTAGKYKVLTTKVTLQTTTLELISDLPLYYLSKQSGKLDVVKSNLDGSDRKVIVAGTGDEVDYSTTLLASRDWKYLVLKAKRAPNKPESLFLINTATDSMKLLDEGNVDFNLIGWSGHRFLYSLRRESQPFWQAKLTAIKSYNAENAGLQILDENANDPASTQYDSLYESFNNYYILDDQLVYTKVWSHNGNPLATTSQGKQQQIVSIKPDGSSRKTIKAYSLTQAKQLSARLYLPQEVYFQVTYGDNSDKYIYAEYDDGVYKEVPTISGFDSAAYPTYLMSPNGQSSLWSDERDGKNVIFVGGKNADNKQEIASKSEFKPYGWLTDEYLLLQKKDSELYITTKEQLKAGAEPLKVSDYHKTRAYLGGYGYGYGGQ